MARMFPRTIQFRQSPAEVKVFGRLEEALPDDYAVMHHVPWLQKWPGRLSPDGEADFVIAHPERGALIVEVKGGGIRYDSQSGKWFSRGRDAERPIADPFKQAKDAAYSLLRYLRERAGWPERWGPIGYSVCFPDARFTADPLPAMNPEIVIDRSHLGDHYGLRGRVEQVFEWWAEPGLVANQRGFDLLIEALAHDVEIRQPLSHEIEEANREFITLSERQFGVLTTLAGNRRVAVSGPAGSGKTLLATEKAKRLARDGLNVLLSCFNRPLAQHLQAAVPDGVDVYSFFQLCGRLAREAGMSIAADPSDPAVWDELPELLAGAADLLGPQYDAIIVDEGQDFDENWWLPLMTLLRDPDAGIFYVFYDDNQAIYRRPRGLPEGLVPARLWENWRNARPIFDEVMRYYSGEDVTCAGPDGPPVDVIKVQPGNTRRELSRLLHRLAVDENVSLGDIVVLTPRALDRSGISGDVGMFRLREDPQGENEVKISSIYRFKGLDANVVILCEVDSYIEQENRSLMYVGCSRAKALLVVITEAGHHVPLSSSEIPV